MPWDIVKFGIFVFGEIAEIEQGRINAGFDGDKDISMKMFLGDFRGKILFLGTFWEILGSFWENLLPTLRKQIRTRRYCCSEEERLQREM